MSNMFDNYENLGEGYTPNNLYSALPTCPEKLKPLQPCKPNKPYELYNDNNELMGYWWYQGDTVNLEFNITGDIVVENNAIIYTVTGDAPSTTTVGVIGQKAYNVIDLKSWTCTVVSNSIYTWTQDSEFDNPQSGQRNIYVTASSFLSDKKITVTLYNFRMEPIKTQDFTGNSQIIFPVDETLAALLVKGVYYVSVSVWSGESYNKTIFGTQDCTITIK